MNTVTVTVKPAALLPNDQIVSINGEKQRLVTVVRIDKIDPQYVRYIIASRKGDLYFMSHPDHDIVVRRPEFDLEEGDPTPEPWANDMRVKGGVVR